MAWIPPETDTVIKPARLGAAADNWKPPTTDTLITPALLPAKPRPTTEESTIAGGPQLRDLDNPDAGHELGREMLTLPTPRDLYNLLPDKSEVQEEYSDLSRPAVPIPKFTIKNDEKPATAVGKEVVNIAAGIPEFFETPIGIASIAVGGTLPRTVAALFTVNGLNEIGNEVIDTHKNWHGMSKTQKAVAVTDMVGSGALTALAARVAAKGIKPGAAPETRTSEPTPRVSKNPIPAGAETTAPAAPAVSGAAPGSAEPTLTPEQQQAREAQEAMAELRKQKEETEKAESEKRKAETPAGEPAEASDGQRQLAAKLVPVEVNEGDVMKAAEKAERPPDVLDDIEKITSQPVRFAEKDFEGTLADARNKTLSERGRPTALTRKLGARISAEEGEPSDRVLQGLALENPKYKDWTRDDLAQAIISATMRREETLDMGAARTLAEDEARTKLFTKVNRASRVGSEPLPVPQLFKGDKFKINGQPMEVTEQVMDADSGKPYGVKLSGAYGDQFLPAEAAVHYDEGTLESDLSGGEMKEEIGTGQTKQGEADLPREAQDSKIPGRQPVDAMEGRQPGNGRARVQPADQPGPPANRYHRELSQASARAQKLSNHELVHEAIPQVRNELAQPYTKDPGVIAGLQGELAAYLQEVDRRNADPKLAKEMQRPSLATQTKGRIETMGGRSPAQAREATDARTQAQNSNPELQEEAAKYGHAAEEVLQQEEREEAASQGEKPDAKWFLTLRKNFNPTSLGEAAQFTGTVLRKMLGDRYQNAVRFDTAVKKARVYFDKQTTPRNFKYEPGEPLPPNWEIQRAIDTGDMENLTPIEKQFAGVWQKFIADAVEGVRRLKPDVLQQLHEHYFARYWRAEDEEAARALSRMHRPWMGSKGFLKARSIGLWEDALRRGLKPRYDNPADAAAHKLAEIEMFRSALQAHNIMKEAGVRRFIYIFERGPRQWVEAPANDPSSKVYGPPTVTIQEAFDEQIRVKTLEMFQALGVAQERLAKIGGKRWGWAREATSGNSSPPAARGEKVATKFGGPDFVFWHEFGHIMDFRYPDLRSTLGLSEQGGGKKRTDAELRALADQRLPMGDTGERLRVNKKTGKAMKVRSSFSSYTRRAEEKMANVFDAYLRAPDLFKKVAPTVWNNLQSWLGKHAEVAGPLNDIRPSLKLDAGETQQFVGGPVLLGRWMMPPDAAAVLNNYLSQGVWSKSKTLSAIQRLGGLIANVRLISAFHGQMVSNDALASGISLPLYDAMKAVAERNPALLKRGAKDLALAPARPFIALRQGSQMLKAIREEKATGISDLNRQLAQYAIEANLRGGHFNAADNASRRWRQNISEAINSFKTGDVKSGVPAVLDALLHTPLMVSHEMMRPVMEWFVPRMKYGLAAPMIERVVADNPDANPWELRGLLGKVGDSVEDRVGQVTYDNLFQAKAVKDSGQLALQAYGWHLTKERLLWGGASDYFKAGKAMLAGRKPEITFRMTYLPALVMTHAVIGGSIMYMMTGKRPQKLVDYLFPETGLIDQYGQPVRMALADFLKDYLGEWNAAAHGPKAVATEWERRLMPVWNELADMYRNKDFWNVQIFSQRNFDEPEWQHLWTNLKEGVKYIAGSSMPFSVKGADRFSQSLGPNSSGLQKTMAKVGPFFGFVPAPLALTQTPAQARAAEVMRGNLPAMTQQQAQHVQLINDLIHDLRTGKLNDEGQLEARIRSAGVKDQAELTRIQERVEWTPLQYQIYKMPLLVPGSGTDAMSVWDLMNEQEKIQNAPFLMEKIQRAYEGGKLDADTTSHLVKTIMPFYRLAAGGNGSPAAASGTPVNRFKAFQQ